MIYKIVTTIYVDAPDATIAAERADYALSHLGTLNVTCQTDFEDKKSHPEGYWYWQGAGNQIKQAPADHHSWSN